MIAHNSKILACNGRLRYTLDADAKAFVTAAGLTDMGQILAINFLVDAFKSAGLWTKMRAIYPFIGGTATTNKFNLKDPRDFDAAYRLTFNGTITHDANGVQGDGSTGYADTHISPANNLTDNNTHLSIYIRNNATSDMFDIGVNQTISGTLRGFDLSARFSNNMISRQGYLTLSTFKSNSNTIGYYCASRTSSSYLYIQKNGVTQHSNSNTNSYTMPTEKVWLCALNAATSYKSTRQYAFASVGDGLTEEEASKLYRIVQHYQTLLGRQV